MTVTLRDDEPRTESAGSRPFVRRRPSAPPRSVAVDGPRAADRALAMLDADLAALDRACSRFRPDSELRRLERASQGRPVTVSPLLFELLEVACVVAVQTAGIVDPTIGSALVELGYDRDFDRLPVDAVPSSGRPAPAPGWWRILLDPAARTVSLPAGIHVDLGATGQGVRRRPERPAHRRRPRMRRLVNLGGDVAVAGPAPSVRVGHRHRSRVPDADRPGRPGGRPLAAGGLATSGTTARAWVRDGRRVHHIIDPWTGDAAPAVWSLVSATAPTCVEANAWTTAAVVWGEDAIGNLAALGVPARLVAADGSVVRTSRAGPAAGDCADDARTRGRRLMLATSSTALWYSTRATGIVALVLLTVTMVLGILTAGRVRTRSWPAFAQADLHKRVSLLAMVFLGIHVVTAVLDTYVNIGWAGVVVPFASPYRPVWTGLGAVGVDLLIAVAVSSALRRRIGARSLAAPSTGWPTGAGRWPWHIRWGRGPTP